MLQNLEHHFSENRTEGADVDVNTKKKHRKKPGPRRKYGDCRYERNSMTNGQVDGTLLGMTNYDEKQLKDVRRRLTPEPKLKAKGGPKLYLKYTTPEQQRKDMQQSCLITIQRANMIAAKKKMEPEQPKPTESLRTGRKPVKTLASIGLRKRVRLD